MDGKLFSAMVSIPINNLHSSHWLKVTKVSAVKESTSNVQFSVKLTAQDKAFAIAPGQVRPIKIILEYKNGRGGHIDSGASSDVKLVLKITTNKGPDQKFVINLRSRKASESFLFTFLDHDGSVQRGAAIAPLATCSSGICPVLLTLHGTSRYKSCGLNVSIITEDILKSLLMIAGPLNVFITRNISVTQKVVA